LKHGDGEVLLPAIVDEIGDDGRKKEVLRTNFSVATGDGG
jgi:hypothetical protein